MKRSLLVSNIILSLSMLLAWIISASAQNTVSFDNQSGEPALVKLIGPTSSEIEVPNGTKPVVQVSAGKYFIKVRYGVEGKYHYTKGQEFTVDETATTTSGITITLHKVVNGNYGSSPITEQEFGVANPTNAATNGDAIELKPDAEAYYNRGIAKRAKGDLDGAIADYTKAIELKPDYAVAYSNRGAAKQAKGDLDGAIADFTKAIELKPDYPHAYVNRGIAKRAKGDSDGAIADCTKAIELKPDYAEAYSNRGGAKRAKGDLDGAIADLHQSHRIQTGFSGCLLQSRHCEASQRRFGRRHRGLHQSHRTQTGLCGGLLQSRRCEASQRRLGRRHRRLHQSHRTQTG